MRMLIAVTSVLMATATGAVAQQLKPMLARVGVVERDDHPPVLELVANAPLAFSVLSNGKRLEVRIYGVERGLVPREHLSVFGRVAVVTEKRGNVLLRLTPARRETFEVRSGARPNIIEITRR